MNTKKTVFSKIAKGMLKKNVKLGLVDEFDYDYDYLQDEVGRYSYSTEEWFDENFDKFIEIRGLLRAVYIQNSESFIDPSDVAEDKNRLLEIENKANELGLSVEDVYPNWQEHMDAIDYLDYVDDRFVKQQDELRNFGL
jgi:hypothetical protein